MNSLSVLVVDDSLIMRKKISRMVMELGHKVVATAENGAAAIKQCENMALDLITMDITMPDMNGIEATRRILADKPNTLIIMVTSLGQESMVMEAINAGAKGYILKPINQEKFSTLLNNLIEHYI
ncbi:response regulator [Rhodospirillum sp. A1_3_36]|uniref:response regulator n=1 Tax=Rhodospirillum sp. A1_3_36 TaxID=3391666 RepID=UPI0039A44DBF